MEGNFVRVAGTGDVPPGTARTVEIGERRIAVCNVGGTLYAIDDACTHKGGSLGQGTLVDNVIQCPLHKGRFDVTTGEVVGKPPSKAVGTYHVRVKGPDIEVALG